LALRPGFGPLLAFAGCVGMPPRCANRVIGAVGRGPICPRDLTAGPGPLY
jgi:hypothetical protein